MQAMICDACRKPMDHEGFELSLLRAAVVQTPGEQPHVIHLTDNTGVLAASLCIRCGERLSAIIQRKLQDPCPTCEIAPMSIGDARANERLERRRSA